MKNIETTCAAVRDLIGRNTPDVMECELECIEYMSAKPLWMHRAWRRLNVLECLAHLIIAYPRKQEWLKAEVLFQQGFRSSGEWPLLRISHLAPSVTVTRGGDVIAESCAAKTSLRLFIDDISGVFFLANKHSTFCWRVGAILTFLTMHHQATK